MDKNERRICGYSSLLIAIIVNLPKLLALRENGIIARYWHFDPFELFFQFAFNLLFCWFLFYLNLKPSSGLSTSRIQKKNIQYFSLNFLFFFIAFLIGGFLQHRLFPSHQLPRIFLSGYFVRLGLSGLLIGILVKIVLLLREAKYKDSENEQLKMAYLATELELLKAQMNPHFLFNALSSLSGVIRENPNLAQKYVKDLSAVFRYALVRSKNNLVPLSEELTMLRSFAQLITMRLEQAFQLHLKVPEDFLPLKLPHLSLQPLLENAVKHNAATLSKPLIVTIEIEDGQLVFCNTLAEIPVPESSNGLGLVNLSERFKILMQQDIEISKTENFFIVKLPLKA